MCAGETPKFKGDISRNYRTEILPVGVVGGREETIITLLTERKKTKLKNRLWRLVIIYTEIKFPLSFFLFGYCSLWWAPTSPCTTVTRAGNLVKMIELTILWMHAEYTDLAFGWVNLCDGSCFFFSPGFLEVLNCIERVRGWQALSLGEQEVSWNHQNGYKFMVMIIITWATDRKEEGEVRNKMEKDSRLSQSRHMAIWLWKSKKKKEKRGQFHKTK